MPITAHSKSDGSSAKELTLELVGTATTSVSFQDPEVNFPLHKTEVASDEFLSYKVQLACFDGKATDGTHHFPFSIMLPPGMYSSMKVRRDRSVGMLESCALSA